MTVNVLAVTDQIDQRIYSPTLRQRMPDVDLVISCGDLPARYLEFLADALDRPVYYVLGNHAEELTRGGEKGKRYYPLGCIDLGGKVVRDPATGLIFAGIPGSPKYNDYEPVQFTEFQVMRMMWRMAPRLLLYKLRHGRALDVLVTHAPPRDINDRPDVAHRGFKAIRRFLQKYRPRYHLHGHVHLYDRSKPHTADFAETHIINVYPFQKLELEFPDLADATDPSLVAAPSVPGVPSVSTATAKSPMPTAAAPADPISH
jgi:hypothetical protein